MKLTKGSELAVAWGRVAGAKKGGAKAKAARKNGKKGGRPKKQKG